MATITKRKKGRGSTRLEARVPLELKETLERAASVAGYRTVTSFVVQTLQDRAEKVMESHRASQLSAEESIRFVNALLSPAVPNAALKRAFKRHRQATKGA